MKRFIAGAVLGVMLWSVAGLSSAQAAPLPLKPAGFFEVISHKGGCSVLRQPDEALTVDCTAGSRILIGYQTDSSVAGQRFSATLTRGREVVGLWFQSALIGVVGFGARDHAIHVRLVTLAIS
jgi:hypothetical protein